MYLEDEAEGINAAAKSVTFFHPSEHASLIVALGMVRAAYVIAEAIEKLALTQENDNG